MYFISNALLYAIISYIKATLYRSSELVELLVNQVGDLRPVLDTGFPHKLVSAHSNLEWLVTDSIGFSVFKGH